MRRTRAGASRLIGALLLVAVSMAAAAILTGWITAAEFQRQPTPSGPQCAYGNIDIFSARYNTTSDVVTVAVTNAGTVRLDAVTVTAHRGNVTQANASITTLRRGTLKRVSLEEVEQRPQLVEARSMQCPAVRDRTTDIEAAG